MRTGASPSRIWNPADEDHRQQSESVAHRASGGISLLVEDSSRAEETSVVRRRNHCIARMVNTANVIEVVRWVTECGVREWNTSEEGKV